jgi:two-component system NarL family response regulator
VLLVDDHAVVREGIEAVLSRQTDMQVVGSVASGREALAAVEDSKPDVVMLDVRMPEMDGLAVLESLRARHPRLKVVMLSGKTGDESIHQALSRGAAGYLLKSAKAAELADGIRQAMQGRLRPSPEVALRLADRAFYTGLSPREIEVLRHAAAGESNKEIADALGLSENTIKNHLKNIMMKLQAPDRTAAVTTALRRGIIDIGD